MSSITHHPDPNETIVTYYYDLLKHLCKHCCLFYRKINTDQYDFTGVNLRNIQHRKDKITIYQFNTKI